MMPIIGVPADRRDYLKGAELKNSTPFSSFVLCHFMTWLEPIRDFTASPFPAHQQRHFIPSHGRGCSKSRSTAHQQR
jgi:hypothetical protein